MKIEEFREPVEKFILRTIKKYDKKGELLSIKELEVLYGFPINGMEFIYKRVGLDRIRHKDKQYYYGFPATIKKVHERLDK